MNGMPNYTNKPPTNTGDEVRKDDPNLARTNRRPDAVLDKHIIPIGPMPLASDVPTTPWT